MEIEKIHKAFVSLKAVRIHEDIILYVKKTPGRQYFGGKPRIVLDKNLNEGEIKNPEKWFVPLLIRAAFSWHVPLDKKENLFNLLSKYGGDIEDVLIDLDISKFKAFDLNKNPYYIVNIPIGIPELSPINMVRDRDGSTLMRVFGKYSNVLTQEGVDECVILEKVKEDVKNAGRDIKVLHI
jgi:hypothetical protein